MSLALVKIAAFSLPDAGENHNLASSIVYLIDVSIIVFLIDVTEHGKENVFGKIKKEDILES